MTNALSKSKPTKGENVPPVSVFRLFNYITPFDKFELFLASVGMVASSANNLLLPTLIGGTLDRSILGAFSQKNRFFIVSVLGIFGLSSFFSWLRVYCFGHVAKKTELKLKHDIYTSILSQEVSRVQETYGQNFNTLVEDTSEAASFFNQIIPEFYRSFSSMIGGTVMLFLISTRLTLITISMVPAIGVSGILFSKFVNKLKETERKKNNEITNKAQEKVSNMLTVYQFGVQDHESKQFKENLMELYPLSKHVISSDGVFYGGISFLVASSITLILSFCGSLLKSGNLNTGSLSSFTLYSSMVGMGSALFSQSIGRYLTVKTSMGRIFETIDSAKTNLNVGLTLPEVQGTCSFKNIYFKYPNLETNVLQNFSFDIDNDEILAITGSSGVGKTTLFNLLTRVHTPDRGTIEIDGHDILRFNTKWMLNSVFGIVNQENALFSGTIKDNIRFGKHEATDKEVEDAAKLANVHTFINTLENGYNTQVGEKGYTLSTGQKQRICLARAIIKDPHILLLDEATSALDGESEKAIHTALERIMKGRTVLMISHRETTLKFAHKILFMRENGQHTSGTYEELYQDPEFRQIINTPAHK